MEAGQARPNQRPFYRLVSSGTPYKFGDTIRNSRENSDVDKVAGPETRPLSFNWIAIDSWPYPLWAGSPLIRSTGCFAVYESIVLLAESASLSEFLQPVSKLSRTRVCVHEHVANLSLRPREATRVLRDHRVECVIVSKSCQKAGLAGLQRADQLDEAIAPVPTRLLNAPEPNCIGRLSGRVSRSIDPGIRPTSGQI